MRRLMRLMGISSVSPKPRTSVKAPGGKVFPHLLRDAPVVRADQAWCADITYIPMRPGFLCLVAVMDWHTRAVLSWRLSNSMEASFCVAALEDALRSTGRRPETFNTDQGVQFTSAAFVDAVQGCGARMSMDGKGQWRDNVCIERLWRSLKHEAVHPRDLGNGLDAHGVIAEWMEFHNHVRPHSAHDGNSPMAVHQAAGGHGEQDCEWPQAA